MEIYEEISLALQNGDHNKVGELTKSAIDNNYKAEDILDNGLLAGMKIVGDKFKCHDIFLPHVLMAAKAMYAGLDLLKPLFISDEIPSRGKVVIGTVQGDLHDIGKNLVSIMLKGSGFNVIDLGNDVPPEKFIETAVAEKASIIGLSALLTTTMPVMKKVVELIKEQNLSDKIKVIIGGAPVTESFARDIGADAYGFDGVNAIDCIDKLIN